MLGQDFTSWSPIKAYRASRFQNGQPIYSLAMFNTRLYILNSPDLVLSLQRQPDVVSFWWVESHFTAKLGGMSMAASHRLHAHLGKGKNSQSLLITGLKATHQAMMPGEGLNSMMGIAGQTILRRLHDLRDATKTEPIDLWNWVRHEITIIVTESVYGPLNPYRDSEIETAFWLVSLLPLRPVVRYV
ncbi:MAG: hypothetical protein Q9172_002796 [Xanthocarpia lactea]